MSEKMSKNVFLIVYGLIVITMLMMSSCGSSKQFHIGTGGEQGKSICTGGYIHGRN